MKQKVQFRIADDGEPIIVFFGRLKSGYHTIFSVYERYHDEVDDTWLRSNTKPVEVTTEQVRGILASAGYDVSNIEVARRMDYFA
jgi:hypothetical protein